ncbi:helix-turn-helix domain-containing protein [Conchiformibius kuhniae]|uniref:Helix-turn-helix domain-containing protein n=1 Tax=Conchiformibius kuhniae TaxID=211502 RepID=A0A8T9N0K1_9NEIS|nr:helix-turn-helix transcriptional regulator [Conchiformibius kuhniae]UOP05523.1 helix-turn-helix domain-containing protein [Conchiformibius kuhniae]
MQISEKIRSLREINQWSQEQMAEKMNLSPTAYARLERGETKMSLERLEKIAEIFQISPLELIQVSGKGLFFLINENSAYGSNYCGGMEASVIENEKLKLTVQHQQEMLKQKDNEIETLKTLVAVLQKE